MRQRIVGVFLVILTTASTSFAEQARPTQQQMQSFLMQAVGPLRSCLARSLPAPPRPHVVVTLEFDPAGGFPMPMEIEAAPGSAIERCVGEALAELNAPAMPGPALRIQCRFPISGGNGVQCRPMSLLLRLHRIRRTAAARAPHHRHLPRSLKLRSVGKRWQRR